MIGAVGGISHENFVPYTKAGVAAFGLGSSLFKPGMNVKEVAEQARMAIIAYDECFTLKN
jgi:2-dehydro-3-deoxyphosphogalactonate aldolase